MDKIYILSLKEIKEMKTIKVDREKLRSDLVPARRQLIHLLVTLHKIADKYGLAIDNLIEVLEQETRGLEIGLYYKA